MCPTTATSWLDSLYFHCTCTPTHVIILKNAPLPGEDVDDQDDDDEDED